MLYCDVDLACEAHFRCFVLECVTHFNGIHKACNGRFFGVGAMPAHRTPWITETNCTSVVTANINSYCVQTQGGSTHQSFTATTWKRLVRLCINKSPRLLGITPLHKHNATFLLHTSRKGIRFQRVGAGGVVIVTLKLFIHKYVYVLCDKQKENSMTIGELGPTDD